MPIYQTKCSSCANEDSIWRRVDDRNNLPVCDACGGNLSRILTAAFVSPDICTAYISPKTGVIINSRSQQKEDLKRSGCFIAEPGTVLQVEQNRIHMQEKAFAPVAKAVDETVTKLVNSGKIES
jgi:putative FmdB family regulatory protein